MSTAPNKPSVASKTAAAQPGQQGFVYLPLIAGWLVPGAGHFLIGKWMRGTLLAVSVIAMFFLGLGMQGKLYTSTQDILDLLCVAGDLGSGVLYFIGRAAGWGSQPVQTTIADYGAKFIVVAGLLNIIAAVDAHNLRTGRKS
jgi:hypothetical protein